MKLYVDTKPTLDNWIADHINPVIAQYHCDTAFGRYTIGRIGKRFELFFKGLVTNGFHPFDTIEAAKAAAQADYERRTVERFREVEAISRMIDQHVGPLYQAGYNQAVKDLTANIQSAIGAGEGEKP